ncbi:hypothetical protein TNCV_1972491 [Trichonephila clavipes]|nr:hypothetical protein TNCV_1972491 [Trichonephila clavipes]
MGQMRDSDRELKPLIAVGSKLAIGWCKCQLFEVRNVLILDQLPSAVLPKAGMGIKSIAIDRWIAKIFWGDHYH